MLGSKLCYKIVKVEHGARWSLMNVPGLQEYIPGQTYLQEQIYGPMFVFVDVTRAYLEGKLGEEYAIFEPG